MTDHPSTQEAAETIRCDGCGRECEPVNDSDSLVTHCVECIQASPLASALPGVREQHEPGCMKLLAWDEPDSCTCASALAESDHKEVTRLRRTIAQMGEEAIERYRAYDDAVAHLQERAHDYCVRMEAAEAALSTAHATAERLHGVTWLLIRDGCVLLERCEKKARVLGVGEWFVPGGKIEPNDVSSDDACLREIGEEWPTVEVMSLTALPIVEGSPVPPGPRGLFLMRPFVVTVEGEIPTASAEGTPLRWTPIAEALSSPVPQVRMMVAAAVAEFGATAERLEGENKVWREEWEKHRRPIYEFTGDRQSVITTDSGAPPSRWLCTKCMRSFTEATCPTCELRATAERYQQALEAVIASDGPDCECEACTVARKALASALPAPLPAPEAT